MAGEVLELHAGLADEHLHARHDRAVAAAGVLDQERVLGIVHGVEDDHRGPQVVLFVRAFVDIGVHADGRAVHEDVRIGLVPVGPIDGHAVESPGHLLPPCGAVMSLSQHVGPAADQAASDRHARAAAAHHQGRLPGQRLLLAGGKLHGLFQARMAAW